MSERWYRAFGAEPEPSVGEMIRTVSEAMNPGLYDPWSQERPSISVRGVRRVSFTLALKNPETTRQEVLDSLTAYLSGQSMDTGNIEAQASPYNKVLSVLPRPNGTVHVGLQIGPTLSPVTDHSEHGGRHWLNVKSMLENRVGQVSDLSSRVALLRPSEVLPEDLPAGLQEVLPEDLPPGWTPQDDLSPEQLAAALTRPRPKAAPNLPVIIGVTAVGTLLLSRWLFRP